MGIFFNDLDGSRTYMHIRDINWGCHKGIYWGSLPNDSSDNWDISGIYI